MSSIPYSTNSFTNEALFMSPSSYCRLFQQRENYSAEFFKNGDYSPVFLYQYFIVFLLAPLSALVPCQSNAFARYLRHVIIGIVFVVGFDMIRQSRAMLWSNGFVLGLSVSVALLRIASLLIFNNPEKEFRRVERRVVKLKKFSNTIPASPNCAHLQKNNIVDYQWRRLKICLHCQKETTCCEDQEVLVWQGYPESLWHRIEWVICLFLSWRGSAWNFRIRTSGPIPTAIYDQIHDALIETKPTVPQTQAATTQTATAKLVKLLSTVVQNILLAIFYQYVCRKDPYFSGDITALLDPGSPVAFLVTRPCLLRAYRIAMPTVMLKGTLSLLFDTIGVVAISLDLVMPNLTRKVTRLPLSEPWLYVERFGPYQAVLEQGVAGIWGTFWHQTFRFDFMSCSKTLLSLGFLGGTQSRWVRLSVQSLVAGALGGLIHAAASYTQWTDTNAMSGVCMFFLVQSAGSIVLSILTFTVLPRLGVGRSTPWIKVANVGIAYVWIFFTFPLLYDEYAKGGMFLDFASADKFLQDIYRHPIDYWRCFIRTESD